MNKKALIFLISVIVILEVFTCTFEISISAAVTFSCISVLLSAYCSMYLYHYRFSLSTAFIVYTILTQFGLFLPYYFFGDVAVSEYSDWTLEFLRSKELPKALMLGSIAISSFELFRCISLTKFGVASINLTFEEKKIGKSNKFGIILLLLTISFFIFNIVTGGMFIAGTYSQYMNSAAANSPIYPYVLICFYVGTLYLAASGTVKSNKVGWLLWFLIVVIFALNGNKGEFLYSLLAVFGIKGLTGSKVSLKLVLLALTLLFIVIPTITSLRGVGIAQNLGTASYNPFSAFAEMGMQIRTSVYTIEGMEHGTISQLWGQSYWQPILNILTPFMSHTTATRELKALFEGYGFNQVIESYLNFKIFGVILFYSILGYYLTKYENTVSSSSKLGYVGSVTTVLINASRNYFAFVPGQIILVSVFYFVAKKMNK